MLTTKQKQEIIDNAPEGAEFYCVGHGIYCTAYLNADKTKIYPMQASGWEWKDIGQADIDKFDELADIRKELEQEKASEHDAEEAEPFKPRMKVEYVKVEFSSIWEGIKAMEVGGEAFFVDGDETKYMEIGNVPSLMKPLAMKEGIYRKVETEIDEMEEAKERQIDEFASNMWFVEGYKSDHIKLLQRMQENGMLAEIILPLK
tara:strand:- start:548 stop:1156 length:609 start_codon:yes stop_codon:yes gene_type:complete